MSRTETDRDDEVAVLRPLARRLPDPDAVVAEVARLSAELTLPKDTIHVISDVHGDDVKLRHVLNNASGTLRPLVERIFAGRKTPDELRELVTLIFYPREALARMASRMDDAESRKAFTRRVLPDLFEVVRALSRRRSFEATRRAFPTAFADLLVELIHQPADGRPPAFAEAALDTLLRHEEALRLVHLTARVLRDLAIDELVLAGDCWDRGPRGDRVVDRLMRQPNVAFIWGNHDAAWYGACLGHEALIAHVLRISARYRRFSQLEEGYGITLQPLEALVRDQYADDPADAFAVKGTGLRDAAMMRRMQKAAAVMQFKLEGQLAGRNPQFGLEDRRLLHRMDLQGGTVEIAGQRYRLTDTHFPTIDPTDPYALSPAERACMGRIRASFLASGKLWEHMKFLVARGSMYRIRDRHLIFHGCVPCDEAGEFLALEIDGVPRAGKGLFEALDELLVRVLDGRDPRDLDVLWYLWCGARSPLFGKDRIATFENDLVADERPRHEAKNPYFRLIHEAWFCDKVLDEFGVDARDGLIVNGHVPVKVEQGESPLKRSGKAVTIDGAFSQAYGDHGYTLVLEPERTALALHHHFESVESAVTQGVDIIPSVTELRRWDPPRTVADTERGARLRREIDLLERLADAYRKNWIRRD